LENGIQHNWLDPGFHRGGDIDWIPAPDRVRGMLSTAGMT
jgi:hypothetical protein